VRALGIDVGVRKGLDLVVLTEGTPEPFETHRRVAIESLPRLVADLTPDVVAIDGPPAWAADGRSRLTERELRWFGIQSFGTPSDRRRAEHPFYAWMLVSFAAFEAVARSHPRYGAGPVRGHAIEVFPHASAVVLAGCLPPTGARTRAWRASVLRRAGIDTSPLRSADQVDAALAALTGLRALRGDFSAPGDPREGVIVVPTRTLPPRPFRRCREAAPGEEQPTLPGMARCACGDPGCSELTAREFAPGHDAKRKSILWRLVREGDEAAQELRRRGWELPPELR
jgi:predicted nuclease with RNAse H fold